MENSVKHYATISGRSISLANVKSKRVYLEGWQDAEIELSENDICQIAELLGGYERTRAKVASCLRNLPSIPSKWFFERIQYCHISQRWTYTAGQDYTGELKLIRNYFKNL